MTSSPTRSGYEGEASASRITAVAGRASQGRTTGASHPHPGVFPLPEPGTPATEINYSVAGFSHNCQRSGCDRPIPRINHQSRANWLAKRYCSHKCAQVARRATEHETRHCRGCQTPLVKRDDEREWNFKRRYFCSKHCARAHQKPPVPKGTFFGHGGYQATGDLGALRHYRTDWKDVVFEDDPRAVRDSYPARVVPKPEWQREL